jgi:hypothetical protein
LEYKARWNKSYAILCFHNNNDTQQPPLEVEIGVGEPLLVVAERRGRCERDRVVECSEGEKVK